MVEIKVNTSAPYSVYVGNGIFPAAAELILKAAPSEKYAFITDSGVPKNIIQKVKSGLNLTKDAIFTFEFSRGEENKNFHTLHSILSFLAESGLSRGDCVIAVGGGVVGDVAGLAAALYMRGIRYVQIPTTLLAAIDSSVGGKTAVDMRQGKNLVGAFHQPSLVLCDVSFFSTLSQTDVLCGLGEGIKYGLLCGGGLWQTVKLLAEGSNGRPCLEQMPIVEFVSKCIEYKSYIVSNDEKESGERKLLNLGHTFGHAIEALSNYTLPHGVCVVKGLVKLFDFFPEEADAQTVEEVKNTAKNLGFDCSCPYADAELIKVMRADKKASTSAVSMVFVGKPGQPAIKKMSFEQMERAL